jgi:hypothetical protein
MNRRKAIGRIILIGGGTAAAGYSGYKWYEFNKSPNLAYLHQKKDLLADLADVIIPPSPDSPGAKEAGVQDFLILMVTDCVDIKSQNRFVDGLMELEQYCHSQYHKEFHACSPGEKRAVLEFFENKSRSSMVILEKMQSLMLGRSFFAQLKEFTAEGYCTSEAGATRGLSYVAVPGYYMGCVPLKKGQKSWATK